MDSLGDYRLRRRLAVGGMGEVYLGEKVGPEGFVKPVVLKCVLPQLARDHAFVQLFLDEARLAALLNHPNIAQIYDFGQADGTYFMAMEYVPGYTVDDVRRKHKAIDHFMPIEHVASIASQACQGLQYAHALTDANDVGLGLVHRDVSPHNLIVSVDGGVKIVDFGIAKARAGLTRVQAKGAVGKFGYMSPEQSRGETVDRRTDVFSLGVCIWELLVHRRLHDAKIDRPPEYRADKPIPPASTFRRDVPKQFDRLLARALSIDPAGRFESCQEMHLEIERFLAAMTHYAGHSALADYIRDLVEGKVEQPEERPSAAMVSPALTRTKPASGRSGDADDTDGLEAAQRYEEVFGTAVAEGASQTDAIGLRAVPKSWEARVPSRPPAGGGSAAGSVPAPQPERRRRGAPSMEDSGLELHTGTTPQPELERAKANAEADRKARVARMKNAPGRPIQTSRGPLLFFGIAIVLCVVGAAGWLYREPLFERLRGMQTEPKQSVLASTYRVSSEPKDAVIYLDGARKGVTPLVLELIPGVRYLVEVKKRKHSTKRMMFEASVSKTVRDLTFTLKPPGTLRVTSKPTGGAIVINGIPLAGVVTPARITDLPTGEELRVAVRLKGHREITQNVTIPARKTRKLHFNLKGPDAKK